jgi:arginase
MKKIKLIKNRSDIGAGTRGSDLGIDAIEIAAINQDNYYFNHYECEDLETKNESVYNKVQNSFAKRIADVLEQCERLGASVKENIKENYLVVLSGDHSAALGTISGIKAAYPDKRLGVVWIDAHADIHSPYTSPSGNIHGMPLAAAMAMDNVHLQINEVSKKTASLWEGMKTIGNKQIKLNPDDLVYFGVRDTEQPEDQIIAEMGIKNYTVAEMRYRGFEICLNEAVARLANCDMIYISFDVDSMDCDYISHGTGTPVPKGFDEQEIIQIINTFVKTNKTVAFEVVEINPLLDEKGNKMAETAFYVLDEITKTIEEGV